jgi:hypothetical protein
MWERGEEESGRESRFARPTTVTDSPEGRNLFDRRLPELDSACGSTSSTGRLSGPQMLSLRMKRTVPSFPRRAAVVPAAQCSRWNVVDVVWESYATSRGAPRMVMPSRGLGADRRDSGSSCHVNDLFGHSSVAWVPWWRVTCGRVSRVGQLGCCESRARGRRSGRVERRGGDDANKEGRVGERERVRNRIDRFSGNLGVNPRGHVRVSDFKVGNFVNEGVSGVKYVK